MKISNKIVAEVTQVMDDYWASYFAGDIEHWATYLVDDYRNIGGTEEEIWNSKQEILDYTHKMMGQMAGVSEIRNKKMEVIAYGDYVMAHEYLDIFLKMEDEWEFYQKFRLSSLLQKINGSWKVLHQHGSYPDSKASAGEAFAFDTLKNEILKLKNAVDARTKELEQKNQELEIETALEKVRAIAMGMHKPDDLLNVCKILFDELQKLGFKDLRNAMINIHDDNKGSLLNYDFSDFAGAAIAQVPYNIHPAVTKMVKQSRKASDAFIQYNFAGKALKEWMQWRKQIGEYDDPRAKEVDAIYYYFYSIGTGSIGISAFSPIENEKLRMLEKFRNVFNLAYQRYTDISLAEAQAREAQIELALERVRAGAMAMRASSELSDLIVKLYAELTRLDARLDRCFIMIVNPDNLGITWWLAGKEGLLAENGFFVQHNEHPTHLLYLNHWKNRQKKWEYLFSGNEKRNWDRFGFKETELSKLPDFVKQDMAAVKKIYLSGSADQFGCLVTGSLEPLSENHQEIISRFTIVFNQTYTRFLDLQKAEAQAREAQIEVAVERIRAQSMAMHQPDDLDKVNKEILNQLNWLQVPGLTGVTFYLINEQEWVRAWDFSSPGNMGDQNSYTLHFDFKKYEMMGEPFKMLQQTDLNYFVADFPLEKLELAANELEEINPAVASVFKEALAKKILTHQWTACARLSNGLLGIDLVSPPSEDTKTIGLKIAATFNQAYQRFLDLQKAAAQTREAEIELALERVRASTMAMKQSNELLDVASVLFQQVKALGVPQWNCGFNIWEIGDKAFIYYPGTPDGIISQSPCTIPLTDHPIFQQFDESRKRGDELLVYEKEGEIQKGHYQYMLSLPGVGDLLQSMLDAGFEFPNFQIDHIANFAYGNLIFITYEHFPEMHDVFKRFAKVFEQTYTRFLDLQKAEAQAREAQIEAALEKVRSRSMAMHTSQELREVALELRKQMGLLGQKDLEVCAIHLYDEDDSFESWSAMKAPESDVDIVQTQARFSKKGMGIVDELLHHYESGTKDYVLVNEGKKMVEWFEAMKKNAPELYTSIMHAIGEMPVAQLKANWSVADFSGGAFVMVTYGEPDASARNLLRRSANVFEQAYIRFLDLKKAEAQAREAQIEAALEKVRSRSMGMQKSEELKEVIKIVYQQIRHLKINLDHAGFVVDYMPKGDWHFWIADEQDIPSKITHPYFESVWANQFNEAKEKGADFFATHLNFEEKNKFYDELLSYVPGLPEASKDFYLSCPGLAASTVLFDDVSLYIENFAGIPYNDEESKILMRFGKVFQQTYTRFLDLQKVEAQAKEAKIETSLERVRSKTMAMHNSNDVGESVATLFDELTALGLLGLNDRCGIGIMQPNEMMELWTAEKLTEKTELTIGYLNMSHHTLLKNVYQNWIDKKVTFQYILEGNDKLEYYEAMSKQTNYKIRKDYYSAHEKIVHTDFFFKEGCLYVFSLNEFTIEATSIFIRFVNVFSQTYRRYLDLQKAEAQAREAQIEAALEKVRSRTLAMQKSDELAETAAEVFRQLISLGIEPNRLYIGIVKVETGDMEMWATDEDGAGVGKKFTFNAGDNESVKKLYDGWALKVKSVSVDMQGKELENYFGYLRQLQIPISYGLKQTRRVQSVAYFDKGFIGMASPDEQSLQNIQLLERFAAVFNLTFTRFNDLKIAEAHAQQAEQDLIAIKEAKQKAEAALTELQATQKQLIQSEKMASLGELTAGIAHEIQNPLNFVNNFSEVSKELLDEMKAAIEKGDTEEAKEIMNDVIQNLEKINHHGKRADGIVKGMLQHSRSSSGVKEPTDINALCDEYLRLSYHGLRAKDKSFNATIKTEFDESIGNINIIPQDIGRVVLNLLTNAFYVVDEKKTLRKAQGDNHYEPTVSISTKKVADKVEISVADNGNGIPQKVLDKIFQPFFTTKPTGQGTGLGLSLSYDIIKAHGGEIKVETKEGEGTSFIINLNAIT